MVASIEQMNMYSENNTTNKKVTSKTWWPKKSLSSDELARAIWMNAETWGSLLIEQILSVYEKISQILTWWNSKK